MANNSSCSYYHNDIEHIVVAALRAGTGVFSALCCLAVIIVIVRCKKYTSFEQRLILYLAIAAFLHSLSYPLARVNYYSPRYLYDDYCYFGGFYNFYSSWVEVLALCCLTFNVFLNAVMDRWPDHDHWVQYLYLFLMYALPLLWSWVPFLQHTYAATAGWCDLRLEDENCTLFEFGYITRFALWYGPVYLAVFACFIATIIAAIKIHKRLKKWSIQFGADHQKEELEKIKPLVGYPIVYLLLTVSSLANAIDIAINPESTVAALWYLHVLTSPFRGAFIAVVYALSPTARKQLIKPVYSLVKWCGRKTSSRNTEGYVQNISENESASRDSFVWINKDGY